MKNLIYLFSKLCILVIVFLIGSITIIQNQNEIVGIELWTIFNNSNPIIKTY